VNESARSEPAVRRLPYRAFVLDAWAALIEGGVGQLHDVERIGNLDVVGQRRVKDASGTYPINHPTLKTQTMRHNAPSDGERPGQAGPT
jgi:hypothetical protein